jgi:hypothetical protein
MTRESLPIYMPWNIKTFPWITPKECKEIHDYLIVEKNFNNFFEFHLKHPKINHERYKKNRIRNFNIFISVFGVRDKLSLKEASLKYGPSPERIKQIIVGIKRKVYFYFQGKMDG